MFEYHQKTPNNLDLLPTKSRSMRSMGEDFLQMLRVCTTFTVWLVVHTPSPCCEESILTSTRISFVSHSIITTTTTTQRGKGPSRTMTISSATTCVCFLPSLLAIRPLTDYLPQSTLPRYSSSRAHVYGRQRSLGSSLDLP